MDREVPETSAGSLVGEQCDEAIINAAESLEDIAGVVEVMRLDVRSVPVGEFRFFTNQAEALARHLPSMAKP